MNNIYQCKINQKVDIDGNLSLMKSNFQTTNTSRAINLV